MIKKGLFIVIEGSNASGKSTVTRLVCQRLRKSGLSVVQTKEPTNTKVGQICRYWKYKKMPFVRACFLAGDRYFHLYREIIPNLKKGKIVVSDRYVASSLAWQQIDGLKPNFIWWLNAYILVPDLTVILKVAKETQRTRRHLKEGDLKDKEAEVEIGLYEEVAGDLRRWGHKVYQLENNKDLDKTLKKIQNLIIRELALEKE